MILYLAADLLWATRIKSTAETLGIPCRPVRSVEMLRARLADSPVRALILDLDAGPSALEVLEVLRADRPGPGDSPGGVFVLAFGPHEAEELFARARELGADRVLARGAFDRHLPELVKALNGPAEGGPGAE